LEPEAAGAEVGESQSSKVLGGDAVHGSKSE
jgi:hypothetical protein